MFKHMRKCNAKNLLENLNKKGFSISNGISDFIIKQQWKKESPLYIRILVGIGAFIASLFFILFLIDSNIISLSQDKYREMIIWGLIFVAIAIVLQKISDHDKTIKNSLIIQSSLTMMAMGKILFTWGMAAAMSKPEWGASIGLLIITCITYTVYPISIDRFLSSFVLLFSILINILNWDIHNNLRELLLQSFFFIQYLSVAILLTHGKIKYDYIPLSYALVFSLCSFILSPFSWNPLLDYLLDLDHKALMYPVFINIVLTLGLISLFGWAAGGIKKLQSKLLILASLAAVFLGFISAPGILFAIALMLLGYAKHEKLLIITGIVLIPVFLFFYYYNLDISLLKKSGVLMGSGLVLLAGKFTLQYEAHNKGKNLCVEK